MLDNIFPVGWIVVSSQVWLQLSTKNLQSSTLSDTVCSYKTQHLSWSWHRQTVEFEAVCRVAVGDLSLEIRWQIYNADGAERAFLGANTTSAR